MQPRACLPTRATGPQMSSAPRRRSAVNLGPTNPTNVRLNAWMRLKEHMWQPAGRRSISPAVMGPTRTSLASRCSTPEPGFLVNAAGTRLIRCTAGTYANRAPRDAHLLTRLAYFVAEDEASSQTSCLPWHLSARSKCRELHRGRSWSSSRIQPWLSQSGRLRGGVLSARSRSIDLSPNSAWNLHQHGRFGTGSLMQARDVPTLDLSNRLSQGRDRDLCGG